MASTPAAKPHTLSAFDDELNGVRRTIGDMGERALAAIDRAMTALTTHDEGLARAVVTADAGIDELERSLERQVVRTIALRAPLADDLRELIVSIRIGAMLERAGDHAKNIAKRVGQADLRGLEGPTALLAEMGELAAAMIRETLDAYKAEDPDAAAAVRRRDADMNQRFDDFTRAMSAQMGDKSGSVPAGIHLLFAGKQLERIGDYAANIANSVFYMVNGEHLPNWDKGPRAIN